MRWNSFSKRTKCQCDWRLLLSQPRHLVVFVSENWAQLFVQDPSVRQIRGSHFFRWIWQKIGINFAGFIMLFLFFAVFSENLPKFLCEQSSEHDNFSLKLAKIELRIAIIPSPRKTCKSLMAYVICGIFFGNPPNSPNSSKMCISAVYS